MPVNVHLLQAMATSPAFIILVACSVVMLGVTLERFFYYARRHGDADGTLRRALEAIHKGDRRQAVSTCESSRHPFGAVAAALLGGRGPTDASADVRIQVALSEQKMLLERNVGVLGTLAASAPLIGLLGTVWGIMRAFNDMAQTASAGPSVVAAGIAEALFTTAAGILIAVPALVLYNYFVRRMNTLLAVAENHAQSLRVVLLEAGSVSVSGAHGHAAVTTAGVAGRPLEPARTR